jgi:hypothetical protein
MMEAACRGCSHAALAAGDDDVARDTLAVEAAAFGHEKLETIAACDQAVAEE